MDFYEFTLALWRRLWFFVAGLFLLIVLLILLATRLGGDPKYESTIQMAVVPLAVGSLADASVGEGNLATVAETYAELLRATATRAEIEDTLGFELDDDLLVANPAGTSLIRVTAYASSQENVIDATLGSFRWLESTLKSPGIVAEIPPPTTTTTIDEEGNTIFPEPYAQQPVTVFLVTTSPRAEETGTARTPLVLAAASVAGLALLVLSTIAIDSWLLAHEADQEVGAVARLPESLTGQRGDQVPSPTAAPPPSPPVTEHPLPQMIDDVDDIEPLESAETAPTTRRK